MGARFIPTWSWKAGLICVFVALLITFVAVASNPRVQIFVAIKGSHLRMLVFVVSQQREKSIPILESWLSSNDEYERRMAVIVLPYVEPSRRAGVPLLVRSLDDKSALVRDSALAALAAVPSPGAMPALPKLASFLKHSAPERLGALQVILRIGPDARECAGLIERLAVDDPDPYVRDRAKDALLAVRKRPK
jgi:HEAT repeats